MDGDERHATAAGDGRARSARSLLVARYCTYLPRCTRAEILGHSVHLSCGFLPLAEDRLDPLRSVRAAAGGNTEGR